MRVELLNKPTRGTVAANRGRGRCPDGKEPAGYSTKCGNKTSLIAAFQLKNMENSWGTRTRTRKGRTRICSVANYTIPQTCRRNRDALSITPANLLTSPILTKISQSFFKKTPTFLGMSRRTVCYAPRFSFSVGRFLFGPYEAMPKSKGNFVGGSAIINRKRAEKEGIIVWRESLSCLAHSRQLRERRRQ